jgi:molybdenum cofactor synthesis domain-containing protein
MGKVIAVCTSPAKGTEKHNVGEGEFIAGHGIKGDAHAGNWHRQVSLLSLEKIDAFRAKAFAMGAKGAGIEDAANVVSIEDGAFGENLVVEGIDFRSLPIGTILRCAGVRLELTQIGKECHSHCRIFETMGECIMPREGVFTKVIEGGIIRIGDEMQVESGNSAALTKGAAHSYRVAIITVSDKGSRGERKDQSGPVIRELAEAAGYTVASAVILPDEQPLIEAELKRIADGQLADLILTTGGTGFSKRDRTPEATLAVGERSVPGIAEAMRTQSMAITKRAMLSRAAAVIRGNTLIVNLPGSPKAVRENLSFIIDTLKHGLDILSGRDGECSEQVRGEHEMRKL